MELEHGGKAAEIRHGFHDINGFRAHVAEAGQGPALLLLHGWPEFWATWEPLIDRLADGYRLIAPDFRGFGESGNPEPGRTDQAGADVLADDIVALLDTLGLDRVGVVGHDVGAFVMQRLAIRHPERLTGLFFFNCATHGVGARWREPAHINEIWYQTFHQMPYAAALVGASRETCRAHIGHFLRHWCHRKDAFDGVLERWVDNFMRPGNLQGGFNWYVSANAGRLAVMGGTAPRPPRITVPARVLWGRHDPVLRSEWADVLPAYFEDVQVSFAEGSGHFVHYEEPNQAAAAVRRFFGASGNPRHERAGR
ncbi:MAG: alpha/beta fold hydrolase [Alphaproteobacteria bacterium]|nr:alpha/beta fold hydrolase [Alphaproteobacteria bacterium]